MRPLKDIEQFEPLFDLKTTQLFSTFSPDVIERTILNHLDDHKVSYTTKKDKYKIKFETMQVGICVRILQVENQKYAIEFTKTGGDD